MNEVVFKNLKLKWWHTVMIVVSTIIFYASITTEMKVLNNDIVSLLSLGMFFISMGNFANQTFQTSFVPGYQVTKDVMEFTFAGFVMIILGLVVFGAGIRLAYLFLQS